MSSARLLMWTLALGLLAVAVAVWPQVPARFPTHYGFDGVADAWAERSLLAWLALPLVGLALAAFLEWMTQVSIYRSGAPGLNLPNKAAILALPPDRQVPVLDRVAAMGYGSGVACLASFALIQMGTWVEANGASGTGWVMAGVAAAVVGSLAVLVVGMVAVQNELDRQRR